MSCERLIRPKPSLISLVAVCVITLIITIILFAASTEIKVFKATNAPLLLVARLQHT